MKTVLFACVHNAGRSQIAAASFNQVADPLKVRAISAGTQPSTPLTRLKGWGRSTMVELLF